MMEKTSVPYDSMSTNSVGTQPMFSRCCCCFPLRVGCFILGYLTLLVNAFRTVFLVLVTLYIGLRANGNIGRIDEDESSALKSIDSLDTQTLQIVEGIMIIALIIDLIWLGVNIACLVGLHKKRPGPIRVYIGFATFRFILTLATYIHQLTASSPHVLIVRCIDLGLTAYFILVYYIYALRLEKELLAAKEVPAVYNDTAYIYPTKVDKDQLVV